MEYGNTEGRVAARHGMTLTGCPRILFACIPILAVETEGEEIEVSVEGYAWVCVYGVGESEKKKRDEGG